MVIAVFMDRDGTLNEEVGYIADLSNLRLIPGAAQAISKLNHANIYTILTTNQSGPARGYYSEDHVEALNQRLVELLDEEGHAWLDGIFYCPHLPTGSVPEFTKDCDCRKPATAMIESALKQFSDINLAESYVLGDKATDVEFAHNAGCKGILLRTGYGEQVLQGTYQELKVNPYWVCRDITEAVDRILLEVA
jgi:D-glycero-D-manno-heptose 1,7-bisphosphate phosphatase